MAATRFIIAIFLVSFIAAVFGYTDLANCPKGCVCDLNVYLSSMKCLDNGQESSPQMWSEVVKVASTHPLLKQLSYHYGLSSLPEDIIKFDELTALNLSQNYIKSLDADGFQSMNFLTVLDLAFNVIEKVQESAFRGLEDLRTLNMSHNSISTLSKESFINLLDLRILILQQNRITSLPPTIFSNLSKLEILDLSYNDLTYLSSQHFEPLHSLKKVLLNSNLIKSFHLDTVAILNVVPLLDLSNNPLDCSCAMSPLKTAITNKTVNLLKPNETYCSSPPRLSGKLIDLISEEDLVCTVPNVSFISKPQTIQYQQDLYLPCSVKGNPPPAVIWETPWGHKFAHPSRFHLLGDESQIFHSHRSYQAKNLILVSRVSVFENGTLHINKFRGYFAGNYTCIAVNPEGNSTAVVEVGICHMLKTIYIQSLFMSGYFAAGALVFGIIGGVVRVIVTAVRRRREKLKKVEEEEKAVSVSDIVVVVDEDDDRSDPSDPKTPLTSPYAQTPDSPRKCTTPTEDHTGWLPSHIYDTLDEARWRLRYGVGRRIEKVRSHVQSIRESSTLYMQSIKESSSSAASRVRTGIVVGVETMKYSVQSLREFCGTGDMGGQTISMISVSTDVDTEQKTEVIRSITFV